MSPVVKSPVHVFSENVADVMAKHITMVIVGSSGSGKSSTGNAILGKRVFSVSHSVARGTPEPQAETTETRSVKVVDTPDICYAGLADPDSDQDLLRQRRTVVGHCREADAVLLTISSDCRYTEEEDKVYQTLKADLGSQLKNKLVVVFTKGDLYPIEEYLGTKLDDNPRLKRVLEEAGNRHIVINNTASFQPSIQESVDQLLDIVNGLLAEKEEKQQVKRAGSPNKSSRVKGRYRLLLMGKTGSGKSSLASNLTGKKTLVGEGVTAITRDCQLLASKMEDVPVEVVDTPGFSDTEWTNDQVVEIITKFLIGLAPGPHAVLFVARADGRFTNDDYTAYQEAKKLFDEDSFIAHVIFVFTGGDKVDLEKLESDISGTKKLKEVVEETGNRYILINNMSQTKEKKEQEQKQLLQLVESVAPEMKSYMQNDLTRKTAKLVLGEKITKENLEGSDELHDLKMKFVNEGPPPSGLVLAIKNDMKKKGICHIL